MYIVYGAQNLLRNDFRAWHLSKVVEHVLSLLEMKLSYSFIDSYIGIASHTRFQNTALRSPKKSNEMTFRIKSDEPYIIYKYV